VDIMSPNRKAIDDVEMGEKSAWPLMVAGEAFQEIHSRSSSNGTGSKVVKQSYEEAFAEAVGKALPQETRDIRSGVSARRSSWGRGQEISSEPLSLSPDDGFKGNIEEGIVRSIAAGTTNR
jgi:hypothetical protein